MAQGDNATNATGAINATGTVEEERHTVVMPLVFIFYSGEGYEPDPVTVLQVL